MAEGSSAAKVFDALLNVKAVFSVYRGHMQENKGGFSSGHIPSCNIMGMRPPLVWIQYFGKKMSEYVVDGSPK